MTSDNVHSRKALALAMGSVDTISKVCSQYEAERDAAIASWKELERVSARNASKLIASYGRVAKLEGALELLVCALDGLDERGGIDPSEKPLTAAVERARKVLEEKHGG